MWRIAASRSILKLGQWPARAGVMTEIELSPRTLRLLDHIVDEGEVVRDQIDSVERIRLLSLLRADLVRIDYDDPLPTVTSTDRGERFVADTDVDAGTTVEALI